MVDATYGGSVDPVHGVCILMSAAVLPAARATGTDPATIPQPDPAPCIAAATTDDADRIIGLCSALVDNENTARADRIKALIARRRPTTARTRSTAPSATMTSRCASTDLGGYFQRPRRTVPPQGRPPRALADFGAALKLNPRHEAARPITGHWQGSWSASAQKWRSGKSRQLP